MLYKTRNNKFFRADKGYAIIVSYEGRPIIYTPYKSKLFYKSWEQLDYHLERGLLKSRFREVV